MLARVCHFLTNTAPAADPLTSPWQVAGDGNGGEYIFNWDAAVLGRAKPDEAELATVAASPEFQAWLSTQTPRKLRREKAAALMEDDDPSLQVLRATMKQVVRPLLANFRDVLVAQRTALIGLGVPAANLPLPAQVRALNVLVTAIKTALAKGHGEAARIEDNTDD